ncbi:uroporphyrinogen-III synthase [Sphingomonas psychrotolerans]|uniref:Uroporphyrinogen-III synthase n=1 Tax=Sphingomonas psychrotolerans TaxID=1327635 RepID=A0ABU3N8Y1_9SPHN|nr:uroporphyrinogen-III synthase [Sphingomonas psychrotolerans]MDT8760776.1 uroporphyrinogen-III synthase [Sphingomonas psychrotolerans]
MSRPIAVLRPEPGNRVTAAAIEARGRTAIRMPLFEVRPVQWQPPAPEAFDALILTSGNALRHAGPDLTTLNRLPVYAVGKATADAALRRGFHVACVGDADAASLLARAEATGVRRALHLAGRERTVEAGGIVARVITVYASERRTPIDVARFAGSIVLVQSARSGAWLGELIDAQGLDRSRIVLVAVSDPAAAAAGSGWEQVMVPNCKTSEALIEAALALAD